MKMKLFALTAVVLMIVSGLSIVSADKPAGNGNGAPSGKHFNLNIIGVPNEMNDNFNGGNGARIFVLRDDSTQIYVHGGDSYQVLDHDGTDGVVGEDRLNPGIILPYDNITDTWKVKIYVRLLGPKDSSIKWKSEYWNGTEWLLIDDFKLSRERPAKFSLRNSQLLKDGYEDILWTLYEKENFRLLQLRIYVEDA